VDGLLLNLLKVSFNFLLNIHVEVCIIKLTGEELMHNRLIMVVVVVESGHRNVVVVVPDVLLFLRGQFSIINIFNVLCLVIGTSLIEEAVKGLNTSVKVFLLLGCPGLLLHGLLLLEGVHLGRLAPLAPLGGWCLGLLSFLLLLSCLAARRRDWCHSEACLLGEEIVLAFGVHLMTGVARHHLLARVSCVVSRWNTIV